MYELISSLSVIFPNISLFKSNYSLIIAPCINIIVIKFRYSTSEISELKRWGETLVYVSCFPRQFFRALALPACFTTEQSTVKASLFVN